MSYWCPNCRFNKMDIELIPDIERNSYWCPACNCVVISLSKPIEEANLTYIG